MDEDENSAGYKTDNMGNGSNGGGRPIMGPDAWADAEVTDHGTNSERAERIQRVTKEQKKDDVIIDTLPDTDLKLSDEEFGEMRDDMESLDMITKRDYTVLREATNLVTSLSKADLSSYYTSIDKMAESTLVYVAHMFDGKAKHTLETLVERSVRRKVVDRMLDKLSSAEQELNNEQTRLLSDISQTNVKLREIEEVVIRTKYGIDAYRAKISQSNEERKALELDCNGFEQEVKSKERVIYRTQLAELRSQIRAYTSEGKQLMARYNGAAMKTNMLQKRVAKKEHYCDVLSDTIGNLVVYKETLYDAKDVENMSFVDIAKNLQRDYNKLVGHASQVSGELYARADKRLDGFNKLPDIKFNTPIYKTESRDTTQDLVDSFEKAYAKTTMFKKP